MPGWIALRKLLLLLGPLLLNELPVLRALAGLILLADLWHWLSVLVSKGL